MKELQNNTVTSSWPVPGKEQELSEALLSEASVGCY